MYSNQYPTELGGQYYVTEVRDLTTGYDSSQLNKKAILPTDPKTQMITFRFSNGIVATLRTSGTEPKIKYYVEYCASMEQRYSKSRVVIIGMNWEINSLLVRFECI